MSTKYTPLKNLETPVKVLFTGYLTMIAVGYLFALIQILFTHGMADGKFGLSVDDIVYSYYGNRSGTVVETKLNGSMKANAPDQERFAIIQWVRDGADQKAFKSDGIDKIIENRCVVCHNKNASGIPDFSVFDNLKALTVEDTGATFTSLIRVSHIHLFGISFIFMFIGIIFCFSETTTVHHKSFAIAMPYVFLFSDILSWWLTKINPVFAWLEIIAGVGMAMSFSSMWLISLLEMWLYEPVFVRGFGAYYLKWREEKQATFADEIIFVISAIIEGVVPVAKYLGKQWQTRAWPFIRGLFEN
jgi:hypothetical protein